MSQQPQEIELKFLCAPDDLGRVLAAAPEGPDDTRELISVYFDTADLDLQKAGASLRVRESRGQRVQTLKRGCGLAREEHESLIESDAPDPSLAPLPELLPDGARARLRPAFHVRVTRRARLVRFDGAEIELAVDQGEVRGGKRTSPISEVELELKSGAPQALYGLARQLGEAAPLYLSFATKSQRGQALVAGQPLHAQKKAEIAPGPDACVGEVFQAVARSALAAIAGNAEVLRQAASPAPETVHQLRVAARTLRSALSTFHKVVEDPRRDLVKAELRWLTKACDDARNLDVFIADTLQPAEARGGRPSGLASLRRGLEAARDAAHRDVARTVTSARFRDLLVLATGWVDTGDWLAGEAAKRPARDFAATMLDKRRRNLLKDGRGLSTASDEQRHHVRIDAKKLRYAAEGFRSIFPQKAADRFVKRLTQLQDDLGALNDMVTAEALLSRLSLPSDAAFAAGELVGLKAADKVAALDRARASMKRLAKAEPFWR
jgi:inorganic triphosphatase YgiF